MEAEPRLGTTSGKPYFIRARDGALVPEVCGDEMSVGMTKFYRTACFREIGGFVREVMWDGIDCHRCRMLGWIGGERRRRGPALPAPAADGLEPEGHLDRPRALGLRAVLHGHRAALPDRQRRLPAVQAPRPLRQRRHAVGLLLERRARPRRATTIPAFRALPAPLPARSACSTASARPRRGAERGAGAASGARRIPTARAREETPWTRASRPRAARAARSTASTMRSTRSTLCLEWCRGPARAAHRDHRQRGDPLHDAARPRAARGLPRAAT